MLVQLGWLVFGEERKGPLLLVLVLQVLHFSYGSMLGLCVGGMVAVVVFLESRSASAIDGCMAKARMERDCQSPGYRTTLPFSGDALACCRPSHHQSP